MKVPFIYETLDRVRSKLNRRILLGEILKYVPIISVSIGTLVFLWRLSCSFGLLPGASLFSKGFTVFICIALFVIAITAAAALNWKRMLTREEAAIWLDDRLGSKGIFSAVLTCLSGGLTNTFSDQIIDDAMRACEAQIPAQKNLFPRRLLFRRSLIALSAIIFTVTLISVWNPRNEELIQVAAAREKAALEKTPERENTANQKPIEKMSDADLARNLFPEDSRLASLAEEAFRNGDQEALNYLMKENGLKPESLNSLAEKYGMNEKNNQADGSNDQKNPAQGTNGTQSDSEGTEEGNNSEPAQGKQNEKKNQATNNTNTAPTGKESKEQSGIKGNQSTEGENMATAPGEGEENSNNKAGKTGESGTGNEAGSGTAEEKTSLASKNGKLGSKNVIKFRKDGTPLEFLLPDKEAASAMLQAVPADLRSSEAAMENNNTPLDYESFVKFYFSTLSKEMQK